MYRQTRIEYTLRSVYSRPARETLQKWPTWPQLLIFYSTLHSISLSLIPHCVSTPCISLDVAFWFCIFDDFEIGHQFLLELIQSYFIYSFIWLCNKLLWSDLIVCDERKFVIRYTLDTLFLSQINMIVIWHYANNIMLKGTVLLGVF